MLNPVAKKMQDFHIFLINTHTVTSCLNCLYWDEPKDQCEKYQARPPLKIAVIGCDTYEQDIPF